jgi:ABC-type uncharacterized transport system YnjBCD ATPase subunit
VAQGIADYAARELTQLALHILPRLGGDGSVPVAMSGGLLANDALRRVVLARLADEPRLAVQDAPVDALAGALRLAARAAGR